MTPAGPDEPLLPVPISALEHWSYCPRQCGLIHVEQTFTDNAYTVRGHLAHERPHEGPDLTEDGVRIARGVPLWSDSHGLVGKSDVVEFRGPQPYPVEYKVGRRRARFGHDELQLAAQAMCLEEMLGIEVPEGAVFYRASQARRAVAIDETLRALVKYATAEVRSMLRRFELPEALHDDPRCPTCSMVDACLPGIVAHPRRLALLHTALFSPGGAEP